MANCIHMVKLCVGVDSVEQLIEYRARHYAPGEPNRHVTRMFPRRSDDLLNGGSLYWVIKGTIQVRQRIIRLEEVIGDDGIRRCAIVLDPELIRTTAAQRRPFQGWRYLEPAKAPADLPRARRAETALPPELNAALAEIGVR